MLSRGRPSPAPALIVSCRSWNSVFHRRSWGVHRSVLQADSALEAIAAAVAAAAAAAAAEAPQHTLIMLLRIKWLNTISVFFLTRGSPSLSGAYMLEVHGTSRFG